MSEKRGVVIVVVGSCLVYDHCFGLVDWRFDLWHCIFFWAILFAVLYWVLYIWKPWKKNSDDRDDKI